MLMTIKTNKVTRFLLCLKLILVELDLNCRMLCAEQRNIEQFENYECTVPTSDHTYCVKSYDNLSSG